MLRSILALLIASLAACQQGGGEPSASESTGPAASLSPEPRTIPEQPGESESPAVNSSEPAASECGADKLARWLNILPTETVKAEIRDAVGHDSIRYIEPGDMITEDFSPQRLNVETGVDGRIKLFRCG